MRSRLLSSQGRSSPLLSMTLLDAAGCLACGKSFSGTAPSTAYIPCVNRVQGVRVYIPAHASCARDSDHGGVSRFRGFTERLQHILDDHPDLVVRGMPGDA